MTRLVQLLRDAGVSAIATTTSLLVLGAVASFAICDRYLFGPSSWGRIGTPHP